ncbi:UDP-N-acetylglucosamine 2-epimerase [Zhenpiania hominis]|uniref:UDP-N-acetylglucosamine 2-epimerase (Hydrolyzing) n=1 Tax=Zhenpiania hominis TaxID=2763644 RepID=A0A923NS83_9FIRM|nr:UDP-N-acetylglucosamine 2-epimerase [Zhenpiania hominis]MBC6681083.1 UDP-N-acetylglucosamine 2-epimerase (hydrolyzing) [Zhenpiania hominis]
MKKIAIITSTRAEFGLLTPVIKSLRKCENSGFNVELIVTGTHLSMEFGYTIDEIRRSGLRIDEQIVIPVDSKDAMDISTNQAVTLRKFTSLFDKKHYSGIVILGDRYEMLAIAIAAGNTHTPIFHLCGGDTTEGAIDEWIRHSITKMSYLHFPTNVKSYKRILQLGESPKRVFNYGSTSIDNILSLANIPREEILGSIGLQDCKYAICTYHPVTMESGRIYEQISNFLRAVEAYPNIEFIVTKSNSDQGGAYINQLIGNAEYRIQNLHVFSSLGVVRYLSLVKYAEFVIGNSSSGIIEAPVLKVPTVNIGDRQKGRLQSESIVNCESDTKSIVNAIKNVMDADFKIKCKMVVSPYGDGHAAEKIAEKIHEVVYSDCIDLKKKFFDIEV